MFSKLGKMYVNTLPAQIIYIYELRYKMASQIIEYVKLRNKDVNTNLYVAITQLAQIPELDINILNYDYLCSLESNVIDPDAYLYVQGKLSELREIITHKSLGFT